jgi:hypothetical protein
MRGGAVKSAKANTARIGRAEARQDRGRDKARSPKRAKVAAPARTIGPPDETERRAIKAAEARVERRSPRLRVTVDQTEAGTNVTPSHSDQNGFSYRALDAFGTHSVEFAETELRRLIGALGPNNSTLADEATLNAALAVVDGIKPENEVEAMLACQMAMTHVLAMQSMSRAHWADDISRYQAAGSFAIKLSRTFTMQMEALAKLRRGGNQTVRVEHVHVHSGGQAIVGNVTGDPGGGGGTGGNGGQPHALGTGPDYSPTLALSPGAPVLCQDEEREALPVASGEG